MGTLQAIAAVGQPRLLERMSALLGKHDIVAGQVLLTPYDFFHRSQYLHARVTLQHLLDLGVLPIVNENDTVADDEIRYGDNDRLAALVSHMLGADVLLMLTDTAGVFTADPRHDEEASLIEEIVEIDAALEQVVGGAGTERGSGGMASKLAAAKIAAWSGVRAVIASAAVRRAWSPTRSPVGRSARRSRRVRSGCRAASSGSRSRAVGRARSWSTRARGARSSSGGKSLLPAGVRDVEGAFDVDATVEIVDDDGAVFAKGLVAVHVARSSDEYRGRKRTPTSPTASPMRSSTATTWSSCRNSLSSSLRAGIPGPRTLVTPPVRSDFGCDRGHCPRCAPSGLLR